eukprot:COSAG01_NODE_27803_length_676_cov_1.812825_1_plen_102_part_00
MPTSVPTDGTALVGDGTALVGDQVGVATEAGATESSAKPSRPTPRWTEGETASLKTGVAKYGKAFDQILKDPELRFAACRTWESLKQKQKRIDALLDTEKK